MKKTIIILSTILLILVVSYLVTRSNVRETSAFSDPHQLGQTRLYGEDNLRFEYSIFTDNQREMVLSSSLSNKINLDSIDKKIRNIGFDNEIFVLEHSGEKADKVLTHLQTQYKKGRDEFFIFTAYEVEEGFALEDMDNDFSGRIEEYDEGNFSIFHTIYATEQGLSMSYYYYNSELETLSLVISRGDELIIYKDEILYILNYQYKGNHEFAIELFNDFINNAD